MEIIPAVRKQYVELAEPSLSDSDADLLRLERATGPVKADLPLLRRLPGLLRSCGFKGTAVLTDHHLVDFEPGDTTDKCYGVAFDIGTTTMVGSLLDLRTGEELAVASAMNPQVSFGDDVVSRIGYASESPDRLEELRSRLVDAIGEMILQLCRDASVSNECVYEAAFAGNTTMEHLLGGMEVQQLGQVPFVPAHARGLVVPSKELPLPMHRGASCYLFPLIGGFVGGDTVSGMLATDIAAADGPVLMIDIGTNGEIILVSDGKILAASTAAGPAFEGARISCGMRATRGAIEKIVLPACQQEGDQVAGRDDDLRLSVIGGVDPIGICGSALVDVTAALLDSGVVTPEGRMLLGEELPADLPVAIRSRARAGENEQAEFVLAVGSDDRNDISITQKDIRELQLSVGAIRAGVQILLGMAGLEGKDLRRVLIAGGFGSFIRRSKAQRIGLLPPDVEHGRIHYVGNASLNGARFALLSTAARRKAEDLARGAEHVELSQDTNFQAVFAEAMIFPSG